jgi:transposase-like protein
MFLGEGAHHPTRHLVPPPVILPHRALFVRIFLLAGKITRGGMRSVLLVVLWRLRYKLSLRDLAELFLERGFVLTHETVRDWEERFAPLIAEQLRTKRRGQAGRSWYVDETYLKVHGKWCYLYRAIDRDGNLVDSRLSEKRDMDAAKQFFQQAVGVVSHAPDQVTTDGHTSYPRAIRETISSDVEHRISTYLNNRLEPGSSRDQATLLSHAWCPEASNLQYA